MRFILLLALALIAGCQDSDTSTIERIKFHADYCKSANVPYEVSLSPGTASPRVVQYCRENNVPYKVESDYYQPRAYETRSERMARFNELGDKLHPTKAEEQEYLRLYSEMTTQ